MRRRGGRWRRVAFAGVMTRGDEAETVCRCESKVVMSGTRLVTDVLASGEGSRAMSMSQPGEVSGDALSSFTRARP